VRFVELADPVWCRSDRSAYGFAGPVRLKVKMIADHALKGMANFVTGGNKHDVHFVNVNLGRDFQPNQFDDLRLSCPRILPQVQRELEFKRGIEVGHIFKLEPSTASPQCRLSR